MRTDLTQFDLDNGISHIEVASINYDQWILTIAIRNYDHEQNVIGMTHVIFEDVEGFRLLDEGAMLMFPWDKLTQSESFVHLVPGNGWYSMEYNVGNMYLPDTAREYIVKTNNECVSVIAYSQPKRVGS